MKKRMAFIDLENVSYSYRGRAEPAVHDATLSIERGEMAAITGLNGSGKSTLARLMLGLLKPQSGQVYLDKRPVSSYSLAEVGEKIGYVLQNPNQMLFNNTVYNEVAFGLRWKDIKGDELSARCFKYLDLFQLWPLRNKLPFNLSEGQKQIVAISAVLALQPSYLILDEPTKSIDSSRKKILTRVLREIGCLGTGIIVISHDRPFVEALGGRKINMLKGKIIADET
jgi:energy-coupling factor transporter ATP-binding protein EcfA2